jgi:beta-lactamase regulating signal transducer with metallopeptidase domain
MFLISVFVPALADLAVKATALLILTAVLAGLMRRASAASRHAVWTAALGAILLLPAARVVLPGMAIPVLPPATMAASPTAGPALSSEAVHARPMAAPSQPASAVAGRDTAWTWTAVVGVVWLLGIVALLLRGAAGTLGVWRLARRARPATDSRLLARVRNLAGRLGVRRRVVTLVAPADWMPLAWGVIRPTIMLPSSAATWSQQRLDGVLVHELAHIARLDVLSHLVGRLAVALLWVHPLVWIAARQARLERERACDDMVIEHGVRASRYADDLLALVQALTTPAIASCATFAMARRSQLEQRVLAVLETGVNRRGTSRASVALAAALIAMTLPVGAAHLVARPEAAARLAGTHAPAVVGHEPARPPEAATAQRGQVRGAREKERPRVALQPAPVMLATEGDVAQAPRAPVDFSGTWVPDDAERIQALFEVGRSRFPGSGVTIAQDAKTLTLTCSFTMFRGDCHVTAVYRFDGSEATNSGRLCHLSGSEVSRAKWDGGRFVVTTRSGNFEWQESYSMQGKDLKIEYIGTTISQVVVFHRKKGLGEAGS